MSKISLMDNEGIKGKTIVRLTIVKAFYSRVEGKQEYDNTYTLLKVCVECVTSLVTKVTSDDVTMMT